MRHWALSTMIGAAILSSSSGSAIAAQGVIPGIYVLDQERSDDAFKAIDRALADLSIDRRPLARMRLRKSIAVQQIRISKAGNQVGVAYDAKIPIIVWIGEEPIKWKLIDELVFNVSATADRDGVSLRFRGDDSEHTSTYRSVGKDLVEDTTIISPLVPTPIVFKRVYNRSN